MHGYRAFGGDVVSEIELPALPSTEPVDRAEADVVVSRGTVDVPAEATDDRPLHATSPDEFYLSYEIGDLRLRRGREIVVDAAPEAPLGIVQSVIVGPAFNHLLHQQGYFVLHASTVVVDGVAAAFLGRSGDGKSTTASAFLAAGHRVIGDDVATVELDESGEWGPRVQPAYPAIKLTPSAVDAQDLPLADLGPISRGRDRRFYRLPDGTSEDPVPLARVYVLEYAETTEVTSLGPGERLVELVRHTYTSGRIRESTGAANNFDRCARLLADVPVRRLRRRRRMDELPNLVRTVETDVAGP